jgi:hypothetical protein
VLASCTWTANVLGEGLTLDWSAPEGCPTVANINAELAHVVGRPVSELSGQWRAVRATIAREDELWRLRLLVVSSSGAENERSLVATTCREASDAAVAILATSLAAAPPAPPPQPPVLAAPSRPRTRSAQRRTVAVSAPRQNPRPGLGVPLAVGVGLEGGTLPRPASFLQMSSGVEMGRLSALAAAGATSPAFASLKDSSAGADVWLVRGSLRGCYRLTASAPTLLGCAGIEAGSLRADGIQLTDHREGGAFWSAGLLAGLLRWHLSGPLALLTGVEALVPLRQLKVDAGQAIIHRTAPVAGRVSVGLEVVFR